MLKIALMMLTLTADGAVRLTLSEAEDLEDCQGAMLAVTSVLEAGGYTVLAAECGPTDLTLTPFNHGATAAEESHLYRVEIAGEGAYSVTPLAAGDACTPATEASPTVWCTRSSQAVAE